MCKNEKKMSSFCLDILRWKNRETEKNLKLCASIRTRTHEQNSTNVFASSVADWVMVRRKAKRSIPTDVRRIIRRCDACCYRKPNQFPSKIAHTIFMWIFNVIHNRIDIPHYRPVPFSTQTIYTNHNRFNKATDVFFCWLFGCPSEVIGPS